MNVLVVDNFDSFTYMLVDYLQQAGADCRIQRNNESLHHLTAEPVDGVVLSPGPGTPRRAGQLMNVIDHYHQRVPMLGVCLGHQALGDYFGARLTAALRPRHGKVDTLYVTTRDVLFDGLPDRFGVTRYHSLLLRDLPADLEATARTDSDELMAMRHNHLPIWGVQFHPEAAQTEHGLGIVKNWINFVKNRTVSAEKMMPALSAS